jgi:protein phosphatase
MPDRTDSTDTTQDASGSFANPRAVPVPAHRVQVEIAARTDRGLVREANEDSYVVLRMGRFVERVSSNVPESDIPPRAEDVAHVMIVADGMGGHEAGEVASRSALLSTLKFIVGQPRWAMKFDDPATRQAELTDIITTAKNYFAQIHASVRDRAASDTRLAGMGTTLTGVYSVGADLFVTHVGDSKATSTEVDGSGRSRTITPSRSSTPISASSRRTTCHGTGCSTC